MEQDGDGVSVAVHVQPQAGRTAIVGRHGDALKVRVAAPPVDDRANEAAVALIAEMFDVPPTGVRVVSGDRSRVKRLHVDGIELETAVELVDRALEQAAEPPGPRRRRQRD
ncbi:MAG: YggU family protein [Actinobacteria bacterium]|nr:YggU family protein [Actinomycetota bacterium]